MVRKIIEIEKDIAELVNESIKVISSPKDADGLAKLRDAIVRALADFESHNAREVALIQDALNTDLGIGD